MAQQRQHQERKIGFKSVQLFKDQILGIGSYGAVCKAKCDDLLCAAKILHPTLFDPTAQLQVSPKQEHRLPIRRFEQECEFLSTIRHPNIVQYLCMHQDPDTGLPILLMELMDESLTHFLENSPQPIAYHIQANICHDIALALSFLHSNGIIHRDLSSNNVLLCGNIRAKVTDFGMAKLDDLNPQATRYIFTRCPGTDVYMPPEAVKDEPAYTETVDCFSFGVIIVQILTQQFPNPGNRRQKVEVHQPGLPQGKVEILLAEVARRQNHISQIDPNHPLLPIALNCLKDEDIERPLAQQLCERIASLKERPEYSDSMAAVQQENQQLRQQLQQLQQSSASEREGKETQLGQMEQQLHQLQQNLAREREEADRLRRQLQQLQQRSAREREGKETQLGQMEQQLHQLQQNLARESEESKSKLQQYLALHREAIELITISRDARERQLNQQVESLKQERTKLEEQFHELEEQLLIWESQTEGPLWSVGEKAPFTDRRRRDAVVDGNRVYFLDGNGKLWACDISYMYWSQLSVAPYFGSSLTILNGLPTTVGGDLTNKLMSLTMLTMEGKWIERFPPMPTKRKYVTAVCTGTALIVGGGSGGNYQDKAIVEVLDIETHQWSTAVYLPESLHSCSATVCNDQLYMLGGIHNNFPSKSVYSCSVSALFQTCSHKSSLEDHTSALSLSNSSSGRGVWSKLADLPVTESTCVTSYGQLLVVGGEDSEYNTTTAVYMYNPFTNSWNVISHMITARRCCFATVLPSNQLMVVGGEIDSDGTLTDSVEFGLM